MSTGVFPSAEGLGTPLDCVEVPVGMLHEATAPGREVIDNVGWRATELLEVDHVEIGDVPGCDDPSIHPSDVSGIALRIQMNNAFQRNEIAALPIPRPHRQ